MNSGRQCVTVSREVNPGMTRQQRVKCELESNSDGSARLPADCKGKTELCSQHPGTTTS